MYTNKPAGLKVSISDIKEVVKQFQTEQTTSAVPKVWNIYTEMLRELNQMWDKQENEQKTRTKHVATNDYTAH